MDAFSSRTVAKQAGLWCVLVMAVVLLTLLFTILGTITCAVLTGMMMAAARHRRWQTIPVSLVFPGVVIVLVQLSAVELADRQRAWLTALCFGAFWVTYLLTCAVVTFEAKARTVRAAAPGAQASCEREPSNEMRLEQLQGTWSCEPKGRDGHGGKRILEIAGDKLLLSIVEANGRPRPLAEGTLKVESLKCAKESTEFGPGDRGQGG